MKKNYTIVSIHEHYSGNDRINYTFESDYNQHDLAAFDLAEARKQVASMDGDTYVQGHNEAGRPEHLIVYLTTAEYIRDGRNGDGGAYDWDDVECENDNEICCGMCDTCIAAAVDQDVEYLRDAAEEIEYISDEGNLDHLLDQVCELAPAAKIAPVNEAFTVIGDRINGYHILGYEIGGHETLRIGEGDTQRETLEKAIDYLKMMAEAEAVWQKKNA